MTQTSFEKIGQSLRVAVDAMDQATAAWHDAEPELPSMDSLTSAEGPTLEELRRLIEAEHLTNFKLWHEEDEARRDDAGFEHVARCKRRIDGLNQRRNDGIERVDACLVALVEPLLPEDGGRRMNTETLGGALDRLSILSLKRFHMREQAERPGASEEHRQTCVRKLEILDTQRSDLLTAALELLDDYARGLKRPRVYRQFKMYNDPALNPALQARKGA